MIFLDPFSSCRLSVLIIDDKISVLLARAMIIAIHSGNCTPSSVHCSLIIEVDGVANKSESLLIKYWKKIVEAIDN